MRKWIKKVRKRWFFFFFLTKGLVTFFQLFKRKKIINVIFMLPKGDLQELPWLGQDKELMDQNMPLIEINPR